jgi:hypothetical protein
MDKLIEAHGFKVPIAIGRQLKKYLSTRENQLQPETKAYLNRIGDWRKFL